MTCALYKAVVPVLTLTGLPVRSEFESVSAFTHTGVLHVDSLVFAAVFTITTVVHLWARKDRMLQVRRINRTGLSGANDALQEAFRIFENS